MKYFSFVLIAAVLGGCGVDFGNSDTQTYCLKEHEDNGYDYMMVTDLNACDYNMDGFELYDGQTGLNIGDIAYVESDSAHSLKNRKSNSTIKPATSYPAYSTPTRTTTSTQPKICLKAYKPKPKPVDTATPKVSIAPIAPRPTTTAPVTIKPTTNNPPTTNSGC